MKKIFLWGYWAKNFGDDLFLKVYLDQMKEANINTYILTEKKYKKFYEEMGVKVVSKDSFIYKLSYKILTMCRKPELYFWLVNKRSLFVLLGGSLFAENKGTLAEQKQFLNLDYATTKAEKSFVIGSNFGPYIHEKFKKEYEALFGEMEDVVFRDKMSYELFNKTLKNVRYEKYGYILSEDRKELIVEEEAAKIVREIFQMTLAEISIKKIVAILNERGEESPMVHNARVGHKHWPHYENKWSEGALRRILECTAYDGYWQKTINGEVCTLSITPILDEGVFEQARRLIKSRTTTDNIIGGKPGPYVRKIYDEATGKPLYLRNFRSGDVAFVFNPQMSELPKKRKIYIEEAKVTEAVKNAISLEMDMAEKMKAYLQTEKMQQLLQKETQQYSEKAWMIFQEMEQVEKDRIPLYEKFRDYEIGQTEYQEKKEEIQAQLQMYENDFEGLMDRLANMKKAYSEENEWIKTFQREELPEKLESQHVKKWVDKIIVSDLRDVHVYLTMQNWKNYFPEEWMEE